MKSWATLPHRRSHSFARRGCAAHRPVGSLDPDRSQCPLPRAGRSDPPRGTRPRPVARSQPAASRATRRRPPTPGPPEVGSALTVVLVAEELAVALALELVVIMRRLANGSPLRSQHITRGRRVTRIEHHALQAHLVFLEVREIELTPRKRDAVSHMTVRISKMRMLLEDLGHKTPGHQGTLSLVLEAHPERQKPGEGRRSRGSLPPFLFEVRSHPPPATELLKRSEVGYSPGALCFDRPRGALDGIVTTALSGVFLWVPAALTCKDDLGAIRRFCEGFAIVVIPYPRGVVRIPEQLVTGEEEGVWHLALDSRTGGLLVLDSCLGRPYGATERQGEQQCCRRHHQRSRHGQQPPSPRSPLRF